MLTLQSEDWTLALLVHAAHAFAIVHVERLTNLLFVPHVQEHPLVGWLKVGHCADEELWGEVLQLVLGLEPPGRLGVNEVSHPCVELDIGVLEGAIDALSLGDPALDLEVVAELIHEVHVWRHEEAEAWVLSKILTELGGDVVRHAGLWLVVAGSPAKLDERIVHKVRKVEQPCDSEATVLRDPEVLCQ